jgi:anti-sigma-K factor RskA
LICDVERRAAQSHYRQASAGAEMVQEPEDWRWTALKLAAVAALIGATFYATVILLIRLFPAPGLS